MRMVELALAGSVGFMNRRSTGGVPLKAAGASYAAAVSAR